ncbi:MAG TPA: 50S ribosomal protein L21 [Candidatus Paceibacterota bacterium]
MTFAIIKTGGKQYRVSEGDTIKVEKLSTKDKALKPGDKIVFDEVLLFDNGNDTKLGGPTVSGVLVEGELVEEGRSKKITIIKFKNKTRYRRKKGHRQHYAKVRIQGIRTL